MRKFRLALLGFFVLFVTAAGTTPVAAEEAQRGTKEEAKALVEKAVAFYEANGKEKTIATVQDANGPFIDRDLYVYAVSLDGMRLANPKQPKLVGISMVGFKDGNGKAYGDEIIALAKDKGDGWVDYNFIDPVTKKIMPKAAYIKKVGDIILVCGAYAQ